MKAFPIFTILMIKLCATKLSIFQIRDTINDLNCSKLTKKIACDSIINPVFGALFESTESLKKLRFLGPELKFTKKSNIRDFTKDSSKNPLTQLIIEMFPSPTGMLNHIRTVENNFGFRFLQNPGKGTIFLADMFVKILKNIDDESNAYEEFKLFEKLLLNKENIFEKQDLKYIKLMTIHAFILNALNDKNDLESYLKRILEQVNENDDIEIYDFGKNILDEIIEIQKEHQIFPYSELDPPPTNSSILIYDREQDDFIPGHFFSDCTDVLLLNICNCLFYDSNNYCYSTRHLEQDSDLALFYKKYSALFTIKDDIRKEWSRVVQCLEDFQTVKKNEYNIHLIAYLKEARNELDTGIINMMNALIKICNLNHEQFWEDFDGNNLNEKLINLFEQISPNIPNQSVSIELLPESIQKFVTPYRTEFFGNFIMKFRQKNGYSIKLVVKHALKHSEMKLIKYKKSHKMRKEPDFHINLASKALPLVVLENYIQLSKGGHRIDRNKDSLRKIYFSGGIETNQQKRSLIINICTAILDKASPYEKSIFSNLIACVLSLVSLDDEGVVEIFKEFLFDSLDLKDNKVIEYWLSSFDIEEAKVYKLWKSRILKLNLKAIELNLTNIKVNNLHGLFKILKNCKSLNAFKISNIQNNQLSEFSELLIHLKKLKRLDIYNSDFRSQEAENVSNALLQLPNLSSIGFINTSFGSDGIFSFLDTFSQIPKLTHLNLSKNSLPFDNIENVAWKLSCLTNLTHLNLSNNSLKGYRIENIASALSSLTNLTFLDISSNFFQKHGAECLSEALPHLVKLKSLYIVSNLLDKDSLLLILEALSVLVDLKYLNLSSNRLKEKDLSLFSKALSKLTSLNSLDLSNNDLEDTGFSHLAVALPKLNNLTTLILSFNGLKGKGLLKLSEVIPELTNLTTLDLSMNNFEFKEISDILGGLHRLPNLKSLNFSYNKLGDKGIVFIEEALDKMHSLACLDLSGNDLSLNALKIIAEKFSKLNNKIQLILSSNDLDDEEYRYFQNFILQFEGKVFF